MAEKEYLLGNRARELLRFTNQATRIVSGDANVKDVREVLKRIAALEDIQGVRTACAAISQALSAETGEGFTRSKYRLYGDDMRTIAKGIVRDIHSANNRPLAKLNKAVKIADACDQGKTKSKTFSTVTVALRKDAKSFDKTDRVFDEDAFSWV